MDEEITQEELFRSLVAACSMCRPDEYQQRHNLLVRQIAMYLTKDFSKSIKNEMEDALKSIEDS